MTQPASGPSPDAAFLPSAFRSLNTVPPIAPTGGGCCLSPNAGAVVVLPAVTTRLESVTLVVAVHPDITVSLTAYVPGVRLLNVNCPAEFVVVVAPVLSFTVQPTSGPSPEAALLPFPS